jgi:predicted alpha-1,2-mannosidase
MNKILFILLFFTTLLFSQSNYTKYVNPFIGTANGGNTFPGAVVPWGMVSVSPHNSPGSPPGYIYGEKYFYGFGHNHLSGTGCADLGSIILTVADTNAALDPESYKTIYSNESAEPGYYSLYLDRLKIKSEVTASVRTGFTKLTFDSAETVNIIFDVGRSLNLTGGGSIKIVSDSEIEGSNISGGFCGEDNRETIYFAAKFDKSFLSATISIGDSLIKGKECSVKDSPVGCLLRYKMVPDESLLIKVGISYTSIENARLNLESEIPGWDFIKVKNDAQELWNNSLSRIDVEGGNETDKIKFYTAFYHMLIHPNIINDVNGEYPLMGRKGIGKYYNRNRYTVFSLWDTYRTLHPFLTLVFPERQSEIIKTMLDMYKENGYLPKWELAGNETYMMVGDPAIPVIADSYIKGIHDFDIRETLQAMLKPVILKEGESAPPERAGYHQLLQYHYIPFEQDTNDAWWVWGPVSTTLEYCFSDWCISQFAIETGKQDIAKEFLNRSEFYKNLFDSSTLFMRPKKKNGEWLIPFDSLAEEGSGNWEGSGGPGYVEGNAWNYAWFVPHDITGLIKLFGGEKNFANKLLTAFIENHFTINNEPDISYPYLFTYIKGQENLTPLLVDSIMTHGFGTGADGLPGNDDCGTISGWFVFSALGFYPVTPADDNYRLGVPLFDKTKINLNPDYYTGNNILIRRETNHPAEILFNGEEIKEYQIKHSEIVHGGELIYK